MRASSGHELDALKSLTAGSEAATLGCALEYYGDPAKARLDCHDAVPAGWVGNALDRDDGRANVWPGAPEVCDGVDNDCDGAKDNVPVCGPRVDQAEIAGTWGGADNTLGASAATVSGCIAPSVHAVATTPRADTANKVVGAADDALDSATGKDFLLYYPMLRNAGWELRGQHWHLEVAGVAPAWRTTFRQPVLLFRSASGPWARYEPNPGVLDSGFVALDVTIPATYAPTGGFSYAPGFSWQNVDWIEVHAAPAGASTSSLFVDDFRFLTP
ncbi:MAG: putative metal-binding motif-containing protein [Myxococcaceae bacterium]|nr:putative metal-binding motif-containing protein [Myxococcaceae bacterium]